MLSHRQSHSNMSIPGFAMWISVHQGVHTFEITNVFITLHIPPHAATMRRQIWEMWYNENSWIPGVMELLRLSIKEAIHHVLSVWLKDLQVWPLNYYFSSFIARTPWQNVYYFSSPNHFSYFFNLKQTKCVQTGQQWCALKYGSTTMFKSRPSLYLCKIQLHCTRLLI